MGPQPPDCRGVHASVASLYLASFEVTEGFLIVRRALEPIKFAAKVAMLLPKSIARAERHS